MLPEDWLKRVRDDLAFLAPASVIGECLQLPVVLLSLSLSIIGIVIVIVELIFVLGPKHEVLADSHLVIKRCDIPIQIQLPER